MYLCSDLEAVDVQTANRLLLHSQLRVPSLCGC